MKKSTGWLLQGRNFGNHFENIDFKNPFWYMVEIYSTDKFIDRTRPKSQTDPACHRTDRTCYPQVSICFGALGLIWGRFGVILERKPKTVQSIFVHQSFCSKMLLSVIVIVISTHSLHNWTGKNWMRPVKRTFSARY